MEDHINIDTIHNRGAAVYFLSIYFMNMSYSGSAKLAVILAMISYFILLGWILCTIDWLLPGRLFFLALVYSHSLICMAWRGLSQKDPCRTVMSNRISFFEVEILDGKTKQQLCFLDKVEPNLTISDVKLMFHKCYPQWYPARQSIRLDPKGRSLKDDEILQDLPVGTTATLYFRDLGPQIGWTMVFLTEYAGPLFVYFLFYFRMPFFYGLAKAFTSSPHSVVHLACCCHSFHYIKRLIETLFVHRFSHGTMPLRSIVKNCFYYWGFAAWFAYYINHPLYTPPTYGKKQISLAMIMFLICETGNFSIHIVLSNLRIDGSRSRKIPFPTRNPFTWLFLFVSCPNYTYEVGSWISFTIMTQCAPVGLFTLIGFIQMTIWAKEKHRRYIREIKDYPRLRMSIIPFLL